MKMFLILVAVVLCFSAHAAAETRTEVWTAEADGKSLEVTMFGRGRSVINFTEPLAAFRGFSSADATASAANVRFTLCRPAGTIAFDGRFAGGTGAGRFRFTPSASFLRQMAALGYSGLSSDQLLVFAVDDFSPEGSRNLRAMCRSQLPGSPVS